MTSQFNPGEGLQHRARCLARQRPKRLSLASLSTAGRTLVWHLGGLLPVSVVTAEPGLIKTIFKKKINWIYCLFKLGF